MTSTKPLPSVGKNAAVPLTARASIEGQDEPQHGIERRFLGKKPAVSAADDDERGGEDQDAAEADSKDGEARRFAAQPEKRFEMCEQRKHLNLLWAGGVIGVSCDTGIMAEARGLFGLDVPPGFQYREDFITGSDEGSLLDAMAGVAFSDFEMRGVVARRRVAFFGQSYDRAAEGPLPEFLLPLRARVARWAGVDSAAFAMALVNEYRPGAPIGWHRDAPQYDMVAGISLLSACRMRFRPYRSPASAVPRPARRSATHEIVLARRSAYLMTQDSRSAYEHHIPPVGELRYSITFRTLR